MTLSAFGGKPAIPAKHGDGSDGAHAVGVQSATLFAQDTVGARLPVYTNSQIADFLINGYWSKRAFNLNSSGTYHKDGVLHYNVSGLTPAGRALAEKALALYGAVLDVQFVRTASNSTSVVDIFLDDSAAGASTTTYTQGQWLHYSRVNVGTDWLSKYGTAVGGYAFQTYVHEIGHALGLGHAGNYNGNSTYVTTTNDPAYGVNSNHYLNDSWQATVMSYFDQNENTTVKASYAHVISPMVADLVALSSMYETRAAFTGNTIWGFHTNIGSTIFKDLATLANKTAFTIFDGGGIDTVDFSGYSGKQTIRLSEEAISDVGGLKGNMVVARGTVLENAVGGAGDDVLVGNGRGNILRGGSGADLLQGAGGNDSLYGDAGADTLHGGAGRDQLFGGLGNDKVYGDSGGDRILGQEGADTLCGGSGADTFVFRSVADSPYGAGDVVVAGGGAVAFEGAGPGSGDVFDLTGLGDLTWGSSGKGGILLSNIGGDTYCRVNLDADAAPEFEFSIVDGSRSAAAYSLADFHIL